MKPAERLGPALAEHLKESRVAERSCTVPGCDRQRRLRGGLCAVHYGRWKRNGDVKAHIPIGEKIWPALPNPWATVAPDCPAGHPPDRVFRWSYHPEDPWPWYCAGCQKRFTVEGMPA